MTWVAVGVGVVGAAGTAYSANKAAGAQTDAANAPNDMSRDQYNQTVARNQPFTSGGTTAFNALLGRLGLAGSDGTAASGYGSLGHMPTAEEVMAGPGYQFGLDQGQNALNRQLNARGMSYSGAAAKAAARYGTDYATTKYNDAFNNQLRGNDQVYNQLMGVSGLGQQSANNTSAYGNQYATNAGNNLMGAGNAQGAAAIAQGNAWGNALNQGVSAYRNQTPSSNPYTTPGYDGSYQNPSGSTYDYTNGGGIYGSAGDYSDERLKTNIRPIGRTARGNTLYAWDWKTGGSGRGVIAQEVAHIPGAVHGDADGLLMVDYSKV